MNITAPNTVSLQSQPVRVGFIPLIDCAPFVVAHEKGFFCAQGVQVELSKEASWASIRDKVAFNLLDGAHMLASLPIAASLGIGTVKTSMESSFTVSHNGNAVTVSNALYQNLVKFSNDVQDIRSGAALKRFIASKKPTDPTLRFAIVYPYSSHNYQLRDWLAQAGIDPDKDVQIIVITPAQMMSYLKQNEIDGYCVGEPWNSLAVEQGVGHILVTGYDIWGSTPEKVFGVNSLWAAQNPDVYLAMIRALNRACEWVDDKQNQSELLSLLSQPDYLNCPAEQLIYGFNTLKPKGQFDWPLEAYQRFSGADINRPLPNYALWILAQMSRWQQLAKIPSLNQVVEQVYRQELYYQALGLVCPEGGSWKITKQQEKAFLAAVASGNVRLHPDGVLKGICF
ncbi:CmpA/NrtA family ABC transporter substrate-binding protein [Marinomonas pollencensis]|uniref:Nitrate/nitrite transport system substrate-binding protein n=1 Tax=Marinomonas pollencensis TaxID=491954 RepID=A0A3E0DN43_9GAMM|nr:CmpA/NrtA family ABC transporter substrate-binding protein [Marinomonas pollencensis]REG84169.1 nitrate/nitrite transport system substrate-binding protein [Marinomonas pollencensis]